MPTELSLRNLVVCVDGTANKFSNKNTNVVKLYNFLKKDELQRTYYSSGIGTSAYFKKKVVTDGIEQATAQNLKGVIIDSYRWLADTYQDGDRIFLFGFSRGAYQVRALAAMIESVGLIQAGNKKQIPFAWELYKTGKPDKEKYRGMVDEFKKTFSRKVHIYFLGAWDTVSSVGLLGGGKLLPSTQNRHYIQHFRHALALDERRVKFLPEYVRDEAWGKNTSKDVWFIGSHSDIGGKKTKKEEEYGAEALIWMMDEAKQVGLGLNCQDVHARIPVPTTPKGLRGWWIMEYFPTTWVSFNASNKPQYSWGFHRGQSRRMLPAHKLHWTVFAGAEFSKSQTQYRPRAILNDLTNRTLTLEQITSKNDWHRYKDYCEGHDLQAKYEVLKLLRDINDAPLSSSSDKKPDELFKNLEILFGFVRTGHADTLWIYGGPKFLSRLACMSGLYNEDSYGYIHDKYRDIVYRVIDPSRSVRWEADLEQTASLGSRPAHSNIVDDISLPRLCGVLEHCQEILERDISSQSESDSENQIMHRLGTPGWAAKNLRRGAGALKDCLTSLKGTIAKQIFSSEAKQKAVGDNHPVMKIAAAKLSCIMFNTASAILDVSTNSTRKSISITEIPHLVPPPPQTGAIEELRMEILLAFEASIQVISKIIEDDFIRSKLHAVAIVEKLLHWVKYYSLTTFGFRAPANITTLCIIKHLATDPAAASFLVYKGFVTRIMEAFVEDQKAIKLPDMPVHIKDQQDIIILNALATVMDHGVTGQFTLEDGGQARVIRDVIQPLIKLSGKTTAATNILINLARHGGPRKQMLMQNVTGALISMMDPSRATAEKACASIRLIVELAKHHDSRRELIRDKTSIMGRLVELLNEELTNTEKQVHRGSSHAQQGQTNCERKTPPIAKQFFASLPVFIVHESLLHSPLVKILEKLSETYEVEEFDKQRFLMAVNEILLIAQAASKNNYGDVTGELIQILVKDVKGVNAPSDLSQVNRATDRLRIISLAPLGIYAKDMLDLSVNVIENIADPFVRIVAPVVGRNLSLIRQLMQVKELITLSHGKQWKTIDQWVIKLRKNAEVRYVKNASIKLLPDLKETTGEIVQDLDWSDESSPSGSG